MLGLPASVKAPALAATDGGAVAQLIAPCFQITPNQDINIDLSVTVREKSFQGHSRFEQGADGPIFSLICKFVLTDHKPEKMQRLHYLYLINIQRAWNDTP